MSEIKVNKISPRTACGTTTLGDSGDTFTIPAGVTISNSGTASGFGSTGEISWDTTPKTGDFTGVSGVGYFINTAGGTVTVTLPGSPSAGNVIGVSDYNSTAATNNITINRNSNKINGGTSNLIISKTNSAVQLVYIDATTGWQTVFTGNTNYILNTALVATGGTETACGDYKIHTFTGPGTFTVTNAASGACAPNNVVSYLVVAGGGSGAAGDRQGAGGAGGFREYKSPVDCYSASPLNGNPGGTEITVAAQAYPITVGGGGAAAVYGPGIVSGNNGNPSIFSTVTSTVGGAGTSGNGGNGGSGGGGSHNNFSGGSGNTPPVSPSQGNDGGDGNYNINAGSGGGGGAGAAGQDAQGNPTPGRGGTGGAGVATSITGSSVTRAGGGGGSGDQGPRPGGAGGGGAAGSGTNGVAGTANTGGGGGNTGMSSSNPGNTSGAGGSGIVVIRYKFQ